MRIEPSTTGPSGRGTDGRFLTGNKAARGNPHARRVAELRSAALEEVSPDDMRKIIRKLIELAIDGDVAAAREVLSRTLGAPIEVDLLERLADLEERLTQGADA